LLAENNGATGAAQTEYVWLDDTPLALATSGNLYFIHSDHLGTLQKATDASQNLAWDIVARPFGQSEQQTFPPLSNLRFPGQYFDGESGLAQNWFRDYDPSVGRYIESDPIGIGGGTNTYEYVDDNPLTFIDVWGLIKDCIKKLMLVTAYNDVGPGSDWNHYKPKRKGDPPGSVGPGTVAVANTNPKPYAYGCNMTVLDAQGNPVYNGAVHDTGAGWDSKHHNVAPQDWIDIWLPGKAANNWGKQWRLVEICCEKCQN
jgi:RHS repeat-associated protein